MPRFPTTSWKASCSATSRGRSPGPIGSARAGSSTPTAARSFSTRSATFRWEPRSSCCGRSKAARSCGSGTNEPIKVNVRLISATNRDLTEAIASGEFRQDLYHRLKVVSVKLPPLRERREDMDLLIDHFLKEFTASHDKQDQRDHPRRAQAAAAI